MSRSDDLPQHFDYASALAVAYEEALRSLTIRYRSISYVAYVRAFNDYCFCEFVPSEEGWVRTIRNLAPSERLAGEESPETSILELARGGDWVSAVQLYRTKHQTGLRDAVIALNALMRSDRLHDVAKNCEPASLSDPSPTASRGDASAPGETA